MCADASAIRKMRRIALPNVSAYEARSNFYAGEILKSVAGGQSLYLLSPEDAPLDLVLRYDDIAQRPHSVEFPNGTMWSFCSYARHAHEWKRFAKDACGDAAKEPRLPFEPFLADYDYEHRATPPITARVERIFSDSMHLSLSSANAYIPDSLIWHYKPQAHF